MMNPRNILRGGRAFLSLVRDNNRLDQVFGLMDVVNAQPDHARRVEQAVAQNPELAEAVQKRTRLGRVDLEAMGRLPEGTLGRAFVSFLKDNDLDPNALPVEEAYDTTSYLRAHMRETHDLWHVMTGFGPDPVGELGLQAFYLAQTHARPPFTLLVLGFVSTFLRSFDRHEAMMTQLTRGWLMGRRAKKLIGTDWKTLMDQPLEQVRARFDLEPARVDAVLREFSAAPDAMPTARA